MYTSALIELGNVHIPFETRIPSFEDSGAFDFKVKMKGCSTLFRQCEVITNLNWKLRMDQETRSVEGHSAYESAECVCLQLAREGRIALHTEAWKLSDLVQIYGLGTQMRCFLESYAALTGAPPSLVPTILSGDATTSAPRVEKLPPPSGFKLVCVSSDSAFLGIVVSSDTRYTNVCCAVPHELAKHAEIANEVRIEYKPILDVLDRLKFVEAFLAMYDAMKDFAEPQSVSIAKTQTDGRIYVDGVRMHDSVEYSAKYIAVRACVQNLVRCDEDDRRRIHNGFKELVGERLNEAELERARCTSDHHERTRICLQIAARYADPNPVKRRDAITDLIAALRKRVDQGRANKLWTFARPKHFGFDVPVTPTVRQLRSLLAALPAIPTCKPIDVHTATISNLIDEFTFDEGTVTVMRKHAANRLLPELIKNAERDLRAYLKTHNTNQRIAIGAVGSNMLPVMYAFLQQIGSPTMVCAAGLAAAARALVPTRSPRINTKQLHSEFKDHVILYKKRQSAVYWPNGEATMPELSYFLRILQTYHPNPQLQDAASTLCSLSTNGVPVETAIQSGFRVPKAYKQTLDTASLHTVLSRTCKLFGYETAILNLLERRPDDTSVHVFFSDATPSQPDPARLASLLSRLAIRRGRSELVAVYNSATPFDAIETTPATRVIFIIQAVEKPLSLEQLMELKCPSAGASTPRHVLVFASTKPMLTDSSGCVQAWSVVQATGVWSEHESLLKLSSATNERFVDLDNANDPRKRVEYHFRDVLKTAGPERAKLSGNNWLVSPAPTNRLM
jgi:hypothetical protein